MSIMTPVRVYLEHLLSTTLFTAVILRDFPVSRVQLSTSELIGVYGDTEGFRTEPPRMTSLVPLTCLEFAEPYTGRTGVDLIRQCAQLGLPNCLQD